MFHTIKDYEDSFGGRVKQVREARGMLQADLAKRCKKTVLAIKNIENHRTEPKLFTIAELARALNISIDYLVYGNTQNAK
jgi:transcriptional regulator with XRE-family HTH domain